MATVHKAVIRNIAGNLCLDDSSSTAASCDHCDVITARVVVSCKKKKKKGITDKFTFLTNLK